MQVINGLWELMPLRMWKSLLPDRIAFYGHVISDRNLPQGARYRYPGFRELEEFLANLRDLGYAFVSYPEFLAGGGGRKALLSFDDGFAEIRSELHPYLKSRGIPYMVFILGQPCAEPGFVMEPFHSLPLATKPAHLGRADIEALAADGVAIGYHTRTHFRVAQGTPVDDPRLRSELIPDAEVDSLLTRPKAFAYPFMAPRDFAPYDALLAEAGFKAFFDTKGMRDADGAHVFRVPMDLGVGQRGGNCLLANLKRCLKSRLAAPFKSLEPA